MFAVECVVDERELVARCDEVAAGLAEASSTEADGPPIARPRRPRRKHASYRLDWAALLKRVFDIDVLECRKCDGKSKIIAVIKDGIVALTGSGISQ